MKTATAHTRKRCQQLEDRYRSLSEKPKFEKPKNEIHYKRNHIKKFQIKSWISLSE
jgi:hypothetical protein